MAGKTEISASVRGWLHRKVANPNEPGLAGAPDAEVDSPSEDDPIVLSEFHQADRAAYLRSLEEIGETWVERLERTAEPHDWQVLIAWDSRIHDAAGATSRAWEQRHERLTAAPHWLRSRAGIVAWQERYLGDRLIFLSELRHQLERYP